MSTPTIRPLTRDEHRILVAARLVAVELAPYLAHALFTMRPVAAEGLGTLAVDRRWRLYADPEALAAWGVQTTGGVLVHEVSHLLRGHAERADALGADVDHATWNFATDAAINDGLLDAGIPLPEGVVTPEGLDLAPNGIEETYYAQLTARFPDGMPQDDADADADGGPGQGNPGAGEGSGEQGCGSGAGDPVAAWELSDQAPDAPAVSTGEADLVRRAVADAVTRHAAGRGTVPGGWERWAETTREAPTVPWRRVLASSVRRAVAWARGAGDYTYARPGRRRITGVVTPSLRRPEVTAAAVVDTSASMSADQLSAALTEIRGVVRAVGSRGLNVLCCDAAAASAVRVRRPEDVRLVGGGGTDMRVGIAAAEALRPAPDVIVVLTDGGTPWPDHPTRARLIVVLTDATPDGVPSWATTVSVPTPEKTDR